MKKFLLFIGVLVFAIVSGCDALNPVTSIEISKVIKNDRTDDNPKLEAYKVFNDKERMEEFTKLLTDGEEEIGLVRYGNDADYYLKVLREDGEEKEYFIWIDAERLRGEVNHDDRYYSLSEESVKKLIDYIKG